MLSLLKISRIELVPLIHRKGVDVFFFPIRNLSATEEAITLSRGRIRDISRSAPCLRIIPYWHIAGPVNANSFGINSELCTSDHNILVFKHLGCFGTNENTVTGNPM